MYHGYRFPPEIISHAVWLYHRFSLSFRDVEDLLVALNDSGTAEPTPILQGIDDASDEFGDFRPAVRIRIARLTGIYPEGFQSDINASDELIDPHFAVAVAVGDAALFLGPDRSSEKQQQGESTSQARCEYH